MEQRKVERKEFKKPLDCKVNTFGSGMIACRSRAVDISSRGLGMMSDYRLAKGMVLRISLPVDDIGITLPLYAHVTWVSPVRESFKTGLIFLR